MAKRAFFGNGKACSFFNGKTCTFFLAMAKRAIFGTGKACNFFGNGKVLYAPFAFYDGKVSMQQGVFFIAMAKRETCYVTRALARRLSYILWQSGGHSICFERHVFGSAIAMAVLLQM